MRIHLYAVCWDEADMLGFFFRHYDPLVDRYVVFDDGSTDGSLELLRAHPRVEVRPFVRTTPDSYVLSQQTLQNAVWKESRGHADWVIVTDVDEHIEAGGWAGRDYFVACARQGVTAVPAIGYQILSDEFPGPRERLSRTRRTGAPYPAMSKLSIFNPNAIEATGFSVGRHDAALAGEVRYPPRDELMLLHFKYLGFERTLRRHQAQRTRRGEADLANDWGYQYGWSREQLRAEWDRFQALAVDTAGRGFRPWIHTPPADRWWRDAGFGDAEPSLVHRAGVRTRWTRL